MKNYNYVQVGSGRLGQAIINALQNSQPLNKLSETPVLARIDATHGLFFNKLSELIAEPIHIELLVICIAPGRPAKWQWNDILQGITAQVEKGLITIDKVVYISSTRVYEGYQTGLVYANNKPLANSERASALVVAEGCITRLAKSVLIVRCAGLNGPQYEVYSQSLQQSSSRMRFAVTVAQIGDDIANYLAKPLSGQHCLLLTDGFAYVDGTSIDIAKLNQQQLGHLAKKYRVLIKSSC
jgi:hypothetical protein